MANYIRTKLERKGNGIKIENAIAFFRELERNKVSSGVHKEEGREYVKRAAHTEFGTTVFTKGWKTPVGNVNLVPPRPVMRMYLYPEMIKTVGNTYSNAIDKSKRDKLLNPEKDAEFTLKEIGQISKEQQQEKAILGGYSLEGNNTGLDPEHNGVRFQAYKGFDDPWIGKTGDTIGHINYKVSKA